MKPKAIQAILDALTGASRAEWELIRRYIDEAYDAAARRAQLSPEDADDVARRLAYEQGMGIARQIQSGNRQERMF